MIPGAIKEHLLQMYHIPDTSKKYFILIPKITVYIQ